MTGQLAYIAREAQRQEQLRDAAHQRLAATATARPRRRRLTFQFAIGAVGVRKSLQPA
jgi:hypothetical protein